jgi:hypothetical protein
MTHGIEMRMATRLTVVICRAGSVRQNPNSLSLKRRTARGSRPGDVRGTCDDRRRRRTRPGGAEVTERSTAAAPGMGERLGGWGHGQRGLEYANRQRVRVQDRSRRVSVRRRLARPNATHGSIEPMTAWDRLIAPDSATLG